MRVWLTNRVCQPAMTTSREVSGFLATILRCSSSCRRVQGNAPVGSFLPVRFESPSGSCRVRSRRRCPCDPRRVLGSASAPCQRGSSQMTAIVPRHGCHARRSNDSMAFSDLCIVESCRARFGTPASPCGRSWPHGCGTSWTTVLSSGSGKTASRPIANVADQPLFRFRTRSGRSFAVLGRAAGLRRSPSSARILFRLARQGVAALSVVYHDFVEVAG